MAKIGPYIRLFILLLLLKHSLMFYKTDRSTSKKYLCDSNFENAHLLLCESFVDHTIIWFFKSMKDAF